MCTCEGCLSADLRRPAHAQPARRVVAEGKKNAHFKKKGVKRGMPTYPGTIRRKQTKMLTKTGECDVGSGEMPSYM